MSSHSAVIYDACVLYPAPLRDLLVQLATTQLFRAKWTNQIHDEWIRNLLANRPDLNFQQLDRVRNLMNNNIQDSLVTGFEYLIPILELPDPDDRHVLAAAVRTEADTIVTFNLKDFPAAKLSTHKIEAKHPDAFVSELLAHHPQEVIQSITAIQSRLKNPPQTFDDYMETLLKQGLTTTVAALRR
jgi:predicted nucleic acid-binding protein